MDQRIEAFLADVLALAGEDLDAVREGVRVALASREALFPVREPNNRRALEARAEPSSTGRCVELSERGSQAAGIDKGAVHASLAMATAPIVLV